MESAAAGGAGVKRGASGGGGGDDGGVEVKRAGDGGGVMHLKDLVLVLLVLFGMQAGAFFTLQMHVSTLVDLVYARERNQEALDKINEFCADRAKDRVTGRVITIESVDGGKAYKVHDSTGAGGTVAREHVQAVLQVIIALFTTPDSPKQQINTMFSTTRIFHPALDGDYMGMIIDGGTNNGRNTRSEMCKQFLKIRIAALIDNDELMKLVEYHKDDDMVMCWLLKLIFKSGTVILLDSSRTVAAAHQIFRQYLVRKQCADQTANFVFRIHGGGRTACGFDIRAESASYITETLTAVAGINDDIRRELTFRLACGLFSGDLHPMSNVWMMEHQGKTWAAHVFAYIFGIDLASLPSDNTIANALVRVIRSNDRICNALFFCVAAGSVNAVLHFVRFVIRMRTESRRQQPNWKLVFVSVCLSITEGEDQIPEFQHLLQVRNVGEGRRAIIDVLGRVRQCTEINVHDPPSFQEYFFPDQLVMTENDFRFIDIDKINSSLTINE